MKKILWIALSAGFLLFAQSGLAQYYQYLPNVGAVNWTEQMIRATGYGAPNPNMPPGAQRAGALEAAKVVALRNLLQVVKGMAVNSQTTVANTMVRNDQIETQVEGVVRDFRIIDTRYMSSGDIEVDVEVPLASLYELFWTPTDSPAVYSPLQYSPTALSPPPLPGHNPVYTGLIIDASEVEARPALSPKVLDELGNLVYGTGAVSRDYAVQIGVVGYEKNLQRARTNERVAANPLIVKAITVSGPNRTDLVIANADAQRIRAAAQNLNFLEKCNVMIVLN